MLPANLFSRSSEEGEMKTFRKELEELTTHTKNNVTQDEIIF